METTKHKPLISELLPGTLLVGLVFICYSILPDVDITDNITKDGITLLTTSGILLVTAWIAGAFLDAVRNISENLIDLFKPLNWDFFFKETPDKVHQFEEYYFAYYVLNFNLALSIAVFFLIEFIGYYKKLIDILPVWANSAIGLALFVFTLDACFLRSEIRKLLKMNADNPALPHTGVYTRLAPSKRHGIGVFAIIHIPKGTNVFSGDEGELVWVDATIINVVDPTIGKLYQDFCVKKGDKLGCPKSFNIMTVGWYLNHSQEYANVECNENFDFISSRDINVGEELLSDYTTYGEISINFEVNN